MSDEKNTPLVTGKLQDDDFNQFGDVALWDDNSDDPNSPDVSGVLNINAGKMRELLDDNPNASQVTLRLGEWFSDELKNSDNVEKIGKKED
jgi:hypothetical protein